MKKIFFAFFTFSIFLSNAQIAPKRKIQLVILFDTSNSMDGLINQAKSKIWSIVNETSKLTYQGIQPQLEIAMYDYGNQSLNAKDYWIRKQMDFTQDLDLVSAKLFGLSTNGGDEFCGAVIQKSLADLQWSKDNKDLKMIFIAGNEPFNQGPISYTEACAAAKNKGVIVSTIFCGDYTEGVNTFWKDGATCSGGDYFNINSDKAIQYISTPYDQQIQECNTKLNGTYVSFGEKGFAKKLEQKNQDENASTLNEEVLIERTKAKSSANYKNTDWDLVDAVNADSTRIFKLEPEELPAELKGKSKEEIQKYVSDKNLERSNIQAEITKLSVEREKYIETEKLKNNTSKEDDLGIAISKSIKKVALKNGFE
ncbi:MAG: VWA domain-containing protein [Flavobacteriia bacterium]|nr:VWA domain-containing protein [Flavobacteriia bacterium]NBV68170.1 VWA domain-containing protein [Flavobacteriia bacterium]NBY41535.1 VWA domain-containing protein [Flavobacteriia bacterium]